MRLICINIFLTFFIINSAQAKMFEDNFAKKTDSTYKNGLFIEPYLFGRSVILGYRREIMQSKRATLLLTAGMGMTLKFYNPVTAFHIPYGVEYISKIKGRFHWTFSVVNLTTINYWANFTDEGIDCTGLWICPPKYDFFHLVPAIGVLWNLKTWQIQPKFLLDIDNKQILPSLVLLKQF